MGLMKVLVPLITPHVVFSKHFFEKCPTYETPRGWPWALR